MRIRPLNIVYILFIVAGLTFVSCSRRDNTIRRTRLMFDTVVTITIYAETGNDLSPVFEAVWEELRAWETALDAYDTTAGLYRINSGDTITIEDKKIADALEIGLEYIQPTDSAFDIRVGGIVRLWDFTGEGHLPSENELIAVLQNARYPVELVDVTLIKSRNTALDPGGLGKGIAADAVAEILDTIEYIERYIIDLGGNIVANDRSGKPFVIGVRDPKSPDDVIASFTLQSGYSCATAGDYQRFFERDGVRYHHIIDPKTGRPSRKVSSVTVIAKEAVVADIISTALFVMGYEKGVLFLESSPEIRAVFFDTNGKYLGGNLEIEIIK